MATRKSKQIILDYIREQKGEATKNDVVKYMESDKVDEEDRTSRVTTMDLIDELETPPGKGLIIINKGRRRGQSHRLVFNNKNVYNVLMSEFDRMERDINELMDLLQGYSIGSLTDKLYHNLVHLAQLRIYTTITSRAESIEKYIQNIDDRETLHFRLAQVLVTSNKVNKLILPQVLSNQGEIINEIKDWFTIKAFKKDKDLIDGLYKIILKQSESHSEL